MKRLLLLSTGGTISQERDEYGTSTNSDSKSAKVFRNALEGIAKRLQVDITAKVLLSKDSSNIVPSDWSIMIKTIVEEYDEYDVFLITHGTNTLGYTSAALSFALGNLGKPIILTGSQVSYGYPGSDALSNLESAVRVGYDRDDLKGVLAVFGSRIITGVRAKKTNEFGYDPFKTFGQSSDLGRIGRALKWNTDALNHHNKFMEPFARKGTELDVKANFNINIVSFTEFPGMQSRFFKAIVEEGAKGIIFRATGAGDPNVAAHASTFENLREGFEYLRNKEIPIVVTTQAPNGVASMDVNEPGKRAYELGAIPAWDMSIEAMTVKLAWLLGRELSYDEFKNLMLHSFRGEVNPCRIFAVR